VGTLASMELLKPKDLDSRSARRGCSVARGEGRGGYTSASARGLTLASPLAAPTRAALLTLGRLGDIGVLGHFEGGRLTVDCCDVRGQN